MSAPSQRHDPSWLAGERRDGWLKLGPDVFFAGGKRQLLGMKLLLGGVFFLNLGKRPVAGLAARPSGQTAFSLVNGQEQLAAVRRGEPRGGRLETTWEPLPGLRGQLLRCVPSATLAVTLAVAGLIRRRSRLRRAVRRRRRF